MCKNFNALFCTRKLIVLFDCSNDKIKCTIYRKGSEYSDNWKVLQSYSIKRPGMLKLDKKTQWTAMRQVLKVMRSRMTKALEVELKRG